MSNTDRTNNTDSGKSRGNASLFAFPFLTIIVLLTAWIIVTYFHIAFLQRYFTYIISPVDSFLRVTLIVAFGGFVLSIPILRGLSRKDRASKVKVEPIPVYRGSQVHPLFTTSRPSRDPNFVIRKTKNRGRISRNRAGERLPPSCQE
jgi:hypothetical protein